jgi:hypothetical protein
MGIVRTMNPTDGVLGVIHGPGPATGVPKIDFPLAVEQLL